ncbi:MAG: hypothetical protein FWD37_03220 [Methanomassiliicoccaceae archaeon]|nr:hypothetical protein [Methanomassiliicoccaceae archaeon]
MVNEEELKAMEIPEITADEKVLSEGIVKTVMMYKAVSPPISFKYILTDKGFWTRNAGSFLAKSRSTFISYDLVDSFETFTHRRGECCVLWPKKGMTGTGLLFGDDHDAVVAIFETYLQRKTR